jgi:hypothetical protein
MWTEGGATTTAPIAATGRAWGLPAAIVVATAVAIQFAYPPNDDATWLLAVARRLAEGGALYSTDLVEINPPLIFLLAGLAVRLSDVLPLDAVAVWRLFVGLQVALAVWVMAATLAATRDADDAQARPLVLVLSATLVACLPAWNFGQREHLILLWFTPYLFSTAAWLAGSPAPTLVRRLAGVMLGLAIALKPHYALAVGLIEVGIAVERRSLRSLLRPAILAAVAVDAGYLLLVAICWPAYFTFAVPLAQRYYHAYSAFKASPSHLAYAVILVGALLAAGRSGVAAIRAHLFALAALGAYGAFVVQHMGWPYHFLPAKTFALLAVVVAVPSAWRRMVSRVPRLAGPRIVILASVLCVAGAGALSWWQWQSFERTRQARVIRNVEGYLAALDVGRREPRFMALSLTLFPAFPVNEMLHARWSSRFSCLWMLPGIMDAEAAGSGDPAGRQYLEGAVCDDFDRWRPDLVLVEDSKQVSTLDQLLKNPRFRRIWSEYRLVGRVEYFDVFRRIPAPAPPPSATAAVEAVDAQGGEAAAAVRPAAARLDGRPQDGPLGRDAGVAPIVGAID